MSRFWRSNGDRDRSRLALWTVVAALGAALVAFSQSVAWFGDERFHLVAAQLINAGKRPYLDFFYFHAPLYAYLVAGWMVDAGLWFELAQPASPVGASDGGSILLVAGFVFSLIPFVAILAAVGVYAIGSRVWSPGRLGWLVLGVVGVFAIGLGKAVYREREALKPCWPAIEAIAREVNRVTPSGGLVFAPEQIYFAAVLRPAEDV